MNWIRYPSKILWIKSAKIIPSKVLGMSVGKWAFPALKPWGCPFHFLNVPGSRPSPQYIFLIHNHQLPICYILYLYTFCTIILAKITFFPSHPNHHSNSLITFLPYPGYTFPWQKYSKIYPYTLSSTYTHKSLIFHQKYQKSGLKSLFFNR